MGLDILLSSLIVMLMCWFIIITTSRVMLGWGLTLFVMIMGGRLFTEVCLVERQLGGGFMRV